jgi:cell division protein FtsL
MVSMKVFSNTEKIVGAFLFLATIVVICFYGYVVHNTTFRYKVLKKTKQESIEYVIRYNWSIPQNIERNVLTLKDTNTGNVFNKRVNEEFFGKYDVGDEFITKYPLFEK